MDLNERVTCHYDGFAEQYDAFTQGVGRLLSRVVLPESGSVLDVGCGTGALTFKLPGRESLGRVVGIDLSEKELDIARKRAAELGLANFEFQRGDACSLPFSDDEFDVVFSNCVLHLIRDVERALGEIHRVLKPGCKAYLQCLKGDEIASQIMAISRGAWDEVMEGKPFPQIFSTTTPERIGACLSALQVGEFEISWNRVTQTIPVANLEPALGFFRIVTGLWRWGVDSEKVDRIDDLIARRAREVAEAEGCFTNTGNLLMIEFAKGR